MHRVVVDLEALRHPPCGLQQLSLHLGSALASACPADMSLTYLLPRRAAPRFADRVAGVMFTQRWRREGFYRRLRPLLLPHFRGRAVDVWHTTHQMSKYAPFDRSVPVVLTIHDLNYLREQQSLERIREQHRKLQAKIDGAALVTTGSRFVANELREHLNFGEREIVVIPHGADAGRPAETVRPRWLPPRPFLFTIGEVQAKKNFHVLLDFIERLPQYSLVIAGNKKFAYAQELAARVAAGPLAERVYLPGMISDGERYWLYQNCTGFVFPSTTEGFGLPVIEAMSLGRPVFVSNATSLPEVAGPLGFYWRDFDPRRMVEVFERGMETASRDGAYGDKLRAYAGQFTWQRAAQRYLDLYRRVARQYASHRRAA